jgi:SAM-dependent methyltransferase
MPDRQCPLCRSPRTATLFTKDGTDYWSCRECGFRFATPDRNRNLGNALADYEQAYLQYLGPDRADEANFDALLRWMGAPGSLERGRWLDVGAGSGKLVRYLRARGIDARGIEPSRALFDHFLSGDPAFTCDTVDTAGASLGSFAVITAFDVIEHVPDPHAFLSGVVAALDDDGVVFLSTPDVESLTARVFGRRWHFYYPYHVSYFAPPTIARAAALHGLGVVRCRHRGRLRPLGYMIRYAAEFVAGVSAPAWATRFDGWYLPVNLFDTMYVALRRSR